MTDTQSLSPMPETPEKPPCRKKKFLCLLVILAVIGAAIAVLPYCPWFNRMHGGLAAQDFAATKQRLTDLESRVEVLDKQLNALNAQATAPADVKTQAGAPPESAAEVAHLQNDMIALSSALAALQTEVKQTGTHAMHSQQATQASLAAAIAFIQLREAATAGRSFTAELAAMRDATKNDTGFQESLSKLEPLAAKGAPALPVLQEELIALETSAATAIAKNDAQTWWEKFLAELRGLVSVRRMHGGGATDAFTIMETALAQGDIAGALEAMKNLPPDAQQVLNGWREKAEARRAIDENLRALAAHFSALANPSGEP